MIWIPTANPIPRPRQYAQTILDLTFNISLYTISLYSHFFSLKEMLRIKPLSCFGKNLVVLPACLQPISLCPQS